MLEAIERMMEVEGRYKLKLDIKRRKDTISCIQMYADKIFAKNEGVK